jgi:TonB family protein
MVSDVRMAILSIQSSPYLPGVLNLEAADGKFIVVTVAIANKQNTAITMNSSLFTIISPDGTEYSVSSKSLDVDHDLFLAQLNPGITKVGTIIFDVPRNLQTDSLSLKYRGGMTGDSTEVPLRVQAENAPAQAPAPNQITERADNSQASGPSINASSPEATSAPPEKTSSTTKPDSLQTDAPAQDTTPAQAGTTGAPSGTLGAEETGVPMQLYHVGGEVVPPRLIYAPDPVFSDEARSKRVSGVVVVSLIVDQQGRPQRLQVVRHLGAGLDEAALQAVQQYKFDPASLRGSPVAVEVNIEVNFKID